MVVAAANYVSAQRQRQHVTMEAWTGWSDGTLEMRLRLSRSLGRAPISEEQAKAIVERTAIKSFDGQQLSEDVAEKVRDDLISVLNGLERLAVGVRYSTYDGRLLKAVGGTTIAAFYDRFERYIEQRRTTSQIDSRPMGQGIALKQATAFDSLTDLRTVFKHRDLCKQMDEIDNERLASIKAKKR